MLLCSILLSTKTSDVIRLDGIVMRAPLYFGNHPKGRSFFWNPEVLTSRGKEREEKKNKPSQICECGPSYTRLPTRHSKCMQSYSCAAASLIHTVAQAFTDASVWKYHIDLLTWDVYWWHSKVGWLLSKVLKFCQTCHQGACQSILGVFGTFQKKTFLYPS